MTVRRIERLINLIAALLEAERPMTAEDIRVSIAGYDSDTHEAFRRAFERDKADLKAMGIPLEVREDEWGGVPAYTIPKDRYYLPQLDLEPDELAALRIAADAILGVESAAESGLLKLAVGTPDVPWSGARLTWNADVAASEPLLAPLYEAIAERRPMSFAYRSARSAESRRRTVEPHALAHRKGHWYLVGHDRGAGERRTFKLARMSGGISKEAGTFDRPDRTGSDEMWELGDDSVERAVLRFSEKVAWWPRQAMPADRVRSAPDGAVDLEVPAPSLDALAGFAVWWGSDVEIISPPEARRHLIARLQTVVGR